VAGGLKPNFIIVLDVQFMCMSLAGKNMLVLLIRANLPTADTS